MSERQSQPEAFHGPVVPTSVAAEAETAPMPRVRAEPQEEGFRPADIKGGVIVAGPNKGRHLDTFEGDLPTPHGAETAPPSPQQELQNRRDKLVRQAEAFTGPDDKAKFDETWEKITAIDEEMRGAAPRSVGRRPYGGTPVSPSAPTPAEVRTPRTDSSAAKETNSPPVKDPAEHPFFDGAANSTLQPWKADMPAEATDGGYVPATEKDVEDYGVALLEQREALLDEIDELNQAQSTPVSDARREEINSKIDAIDATFDAMNKNSGTKWSMRAGMAYENSKLSATRWAFNKLSKGAEHFNSMEAGKRRRVLKVASVALGGVLATGAVLLAHKAGVLDQLGDLMGDAPVSKNTPPVEITTEVGPNPPSTKEAETAVGEVKPPKQEEVAPPVAEEVSKAARRIKPGEGWYNTLKELDIPKKQWDKLLADDTLRDQLIKNGDAYVMPDGSLGMNDNSSHKLGMDSIRDIQEAAGIDITSDAPKIEQEVPPVEDGDANTSDTTEVQPTNESPTVPTVESASDITRPLMVLGAGAVALTGGVLFAGYYKKNVAEGYKWKKESLAELFSNHEHPLANILTALAHIAKEKGKVQTPEEAGAILERLYVADDEAYDAFVEHFGLQKASEHGFTRGDIRVLNSIMESLAEEDIEPVMGR